MERTTNGKISSALEPPAGVKYVLVSAGMTNSYLVRDDGVIDKVRGGKVVASLSPKDATTGTTFISCSDQLTCQNDKNVHGAHANYLIRSDGVAERMVGLSTEPQLMVPPAGKYISASAGESCSYLLRDNGIVDRSVRNGTVQKEMIPEHGTLYIQVGAGQSASYLLRNDGKVARTRTGGNIASVMVPPTRQEFLDQTKDCSIM